MIVGASSKDFAKFAVFIKLERIFSLMKSLWKARVWSRLWGKYTLMIHIIPALFNNISAKILLRSLKIPITDVSYLAHSFPLNSFSDSCPDSLVLTLYHCILVQNWVYLQKDKTQLIHISFLTTSTYIPNNTGNSPALSSVVKIHCCCQLVVIGWLPVGWKMKRVTIKYNIISCWLSQNSEQNCCREY